MSVPMKASQFSSTETWTLSLQARTLVGFGYSLTVTLKQQVLVLPALSVATKQLVVVPIGKALPEGIPAVCVGVASTPWRPTTLKARERPAKPTLANVP